MAEIGKQSIKNVPATRSFTNAVYYPNYRVYRDQPPSKLNFAVISHVFYAFAGITKKGEICLTDEWADTGIDLDGVKGCIRSLVALKSSPPNSHLKLIISVGGAGSGEMFAAVASDPELREKFAHSARSFVDQYGFDGIDIDWEHPSDQNQGQNYVLLLSALRFSLPSARYLLASALPAGEWALKHIDLTQAFSLLDFVTLMAYDFTGPWSESGHHAALFSEGPQSPSAHSAVKYLLLKPAIPLEKVLIGIPCYGRAFAIDQKDGKGPKGEEHGRAVEYREMPQHKVQKQIDEQVCAASTISDGEWITHDNPATVRMKAKYVRESGLGGLIYWEASQDHDDQDKSLVFAGYKGLHDQW